MIAALFAAATAAQIAIEQCPKLVEDPALTAAAATFAEASLLRAKPDARALRFEVQKRTWDPAPEGFFAKVAPASQWPDALAGLFPKPCRAAAFGAAVRDAEGAAIVALVIVSRESQLEPLAREVVEGKPLRLGGTLGSNLSDPELVIETPSGTIERLPVSVNGFRFSSTLTPIRGVSTLEVLARTNHGPRVIGLRKIYAGVPASQEPPDEKIPEGDASVVERQIAAIRAGRGLPLLLRDPMLDALAAAQSRRMRNAGELAHALPDDLETRLDRAGYACIWAGENLGLGANAAAAQSAIEQSPAHRAILLDPRGTRLGLAAQEDGVRTWLTEILAAPAGQVKDPVAAIRAALAAARAAHGLRPVAADAALDKFAREAALTMALADDPAALSSEGRPLREAALAAGATTAAADAIVATSPSDAASAEHLLDPRWKRVGVGTHYATTVKHGAGRLWIAIVFAAP